MPTTASPTAAPTSPPVDSEPKYCGCHDCTDEVWATLAGAYSCGDRITYKMEVFGGDLPEEEACAFVSAEYPSICGPYCDPSTCDGGCFLYAEPYTAPADTITPSTLSLQDPLYCYPDHNQRERYTNAFGGTYVIEAKDGQGGPCGPGDNAFTADTVSYDATLQELTLEYKMIGSSWKASEVRLLKSEADPTFGYGTFTFSIKSVSVYDESNNIVSSSLPPDLVLGLFTWDTTDDYSINENWNHEVDVEISQWGDSSQVNDVQFLVQPHHPGGPHFPDRLSSGGESATSSADFDQGGHTYEFTWEPNQISWHTTAGGGQSRMYSTQIAKDACAEDYIQCLPANVEVRLNLWDMNGANGGSFAPDVAGLNDGTRVEVVLDDFAFTPSSMDHVPDGGSCSKNCQCSPSSTCGASGTCVLTNPPSAAPVVRMYDDFDMEHNTVDNWTWRQPYHMWRVVRPLCPQGTDDPCTTQAVYTGVQNPVAHDDRVATLSYPAGRPEGENGPGYSTLMLSDTELLLYGNWESRLRTPDAGPAEGVVSAFYTYFNDGTDHDGDGLIDNHEIDFELLNTDRGAVWCTVYTQKNGCEGVDGEFDNQCTEMDRVSARVDLRTGEILATEPGVDQGTWNLSEQQGLQTSAPGFQPIPNFDHASAFYTYGIEWREHRVTWWIEGPGIEGRLRLWEVHSERYGTHAIPSMPSKTMFNLWRTNRDWITQQSATNLSQNIIMEIDYVKVEELG